jgi:hypothetical protein
LGGEKKRAGRIANDAQSLKVSAKRILETVEGKRKKERWKVSEKYWRRFSLLGSWCCVLWYLHPLSSIVMVRTSL